MEKGIEQGLKQGSGKFKLEDLYTEAVKLAIKKKAFEHAALAVQTTKDQLQGLLQSAIDEGWGVPELASNIRETFAFNSKVRSLRIARTELTDTINDGTTRALQKEGYQQKTWSTVIDGNERPSHGAADGQTVGIHETFRLTGGSARYPGDEVLPPEERIGCRCVVVGADLPEDRVRVLGESFLRIHGSLENKFVIALRLAFRGQRDRILSRLTS